MDFDDRIKNEKQVGLVNDQRGESMKFTGDPQGIEELKQIKDNNVTYLKYLLQEARTNFYRTAEFKGSDGVTKYKITFSPQTGDLEVEKVT